MKVLKKECYDTLYANISNNVERYSEKFKWVNNFLDKKEVYDTIQTTLDLNVELSFENGAKDDIVNCRLVYDALKDKITRNEATNIYFWTYLSHFDFYEYSVKRWGSSDVKSRFFCKSNRKGLLRNSISRLYWFAELTYLKDENNKYLLTELLLENQDIALQIVERNFSMNKDIIYGILMAKKEIDDDNKINNVDMNELRDLAKYLTRQGAVKVIDILEKDEIKELCKDYILNKRNKGK